MPYSMNIDGIALSGIDIINLKKIVLEPGIKWGEANARSISTGGLMYLVSRGLVDVKSAELYPNERTHKVISRWQEEERRVVERRRISNAAARIRKLTEIITLGKVKVFPKAAAKVNDKWYIISDSQGNIEYPHYGAQQFSSVVAFEYERFVVCFLLGVNCKVLYPCVWVFVDGKGSEQGHPYCKRLKQVPEVEKALRNRCGEISRLLYLQEL